MLGLAQEDLHIISSPKRRTIELQIRHGIHLRVPTRVGSEEVCQFLLRKQNWLRQHIQNQSIEQLQQMNQNIGAAPELPELLLKKQQEHGLPFLFLGRGYLLQSRQPETSPHKGLQIIPNPPHLPLLSYPLAKSGKSEQSLEKILRRTALRLLEKRCERYRKYLALPPIQTIKIRKYKARWGSCSQSGALTFNWQLIFAPIPVIDYVVVHELAHLHEFNHSPRFWEWVHKAMPDYRRYRQWLKYWGPYLLRF